MGVSNKFQYSWLVQVEVHHHGVWPLVINPGKCEEEGNTNRG